MRSPSQQRSMAKAKAKVKSKGKGKRKERGPIASSTPLDSNSLDGIGLMSRGVLKILNCNIEILFYIKKKILGYSRRWSYRSW